MQNFNLGDIVSLTSHPYYQNITSIIIGGEQHHVSPLMIIIEILVDTKNQFDEKTGNDISIRGMLQCKCTWYSHRSHQFEEAWLSSKNLKVVVKSDPKLDRESFIRKDNETNINDESKNFNQPKPTIYYDVAFKTLSHELKKVKSSITTTINNSDGSNKKITVNSLLSFVSPVMQVIQIIELKSQEQKDPIYDARTGQRKRIQPELLVKCKWFNANSDKLSEKLLPIEALNIIPYVTENDFKKIDFNIQHCNYLMYQNSAVRLTQLYYSDGFYSVKAFDYLYNKEIDIDALEATKLAPIISLIDATAPQFDFQDGEILTNQYFSDQFKLLIENCNKNVNELYIRIEYKNRNDKVSIRTLRPIESKFTIINIVKDNVEKSYLSAFCITKNDVRTFNINRIQKMQVLNLNI